MLVQPPVAPVQFYCLRRRNGITDLTAGKAYLMFLAPDALAECTDRVTALIQAINPGVHGEPASVPGMGRQGRVFALPAVRIHAMKSAARHTAAPVRL